MTKLLKAFSKNRASAPKTLVIPSVKSKQGSTKHYPRYNIDKEPLIMALQRTTDPPVSSNVNICKHYFLKNRHVRTIKKLTILFVTGLDDLHSRHLIDDEASN